MGPRTLPGTSINSPHSCPGFSTQERVPELAPLGHVCSDPALALQQLRTPPSPSSLGASYLTGLGLQLRTLHTSVISECTKAALRTLARVTRRLQLWVRGLQTQGRHLGIFPAPFMRQWLPHGPCLPRLRPPCQWPGLAQPCLSPRLGVPASLSIGGFPQATSYP